MADGQQLSYPDASAWMLDHIGAKVYVRTWLDPWPKGRIAEWRGSVLPPDKSEPDTFRVGEHGWIDTTLIEAATIESDLVTFTLADGVHLSIAEV